MTQADNPESSENNNYNGQSTAADVEKAELENQSGEPQDELATAKLEIEKMKGELAALQDKYLRSLADFDNFKKRAQKERSELLKYQGEQLIVDLLSVIDDFDLAVNFNNDGQIKEYDPEKFREGIGLIYKSFCEILKKWDIRPESSIGQTFDPKKNLAISRVALEDATPGTVVSELKKAFFYKDKIIRVGEVVVAVQASPS